MLSCSKQKSAQKNIIRKMKAFFKYPKMATKQRLYTWQNPHFGSKIKNA